MKKLIAILLSFTIILSFVPSALAADVEAINAANRLNVLGLFSGTGTDANGNPKFDLDRAPTRHEAVTMLVRLLGKEDEAKNGSWTIPFTDVADWAKPYVGYAYKNGLTSGTSATKYSGDQNVTATQYLTFALRALGYESGTDFQWDRAWELSDKIGLTDGRYKENTAPFTRGDVAIISYSAIVIINNSIKKLCTEENIQGIWRLSDDDRGEEYIFSGGNYTHAIIQRENGTPTGTYWLETGSYKLEGGSCTFVYNLMDISESTNGVHTSDEVRKTWGILFEDENHFLFGINRYTRSSDSVITPQVHDAISAKQSTLSNAQRTQISKSIASAANNIAEGLELTLSAGLSYVNKISSFGSNYQRYAEAEKNFLLAAEMSYFQAKAAVSEIKDIANLSGYTEIVSRCNRCIIILDQLSAIDEMNSSAMDIVASYSKELEVLLTEISDLNGIR